MDVKHFIEDFKKFVSEPDNIEFDVKTLDLVTYRNLNIYFQDGVLKTITFEQPGVNIEIDGSYVNEGQLIDYCMKLTELGFKIQDLNKEIINIEQKALNEVLSCD